jgi:uncharacterized protein (DUF433 family)
LDKTAKEQYVPAAMTIQLAPLIVSDKHTLSGKPRVEGTRISVQLVLENLEAGETIDQILENYPSLTREGILACIGYAKKLVADETILFTAA